MCFCFVVPHLDSQHVDRDTLLGKAFLVSGLARKVLNNYRDQRSQIKDQRSSTHSLGADVVPVGVGRGDGDLKR